MRIRFSALMLLLATFVPALTVATEIFKWENPNGDPRYGAVLVPLTPSSMVENQKLSGTRVEVLVALVFEDTPGDQQQWRSKNFRVSLEQPSETTIYERTAIALECEDFDFRFATTCKPDGSDLKIRVRGEVQQNWNSPWMAVDQTFVFKAYNKLQLLGTMVDANGNDVPTFELASSRMYQNAVSALSGSHTYSPGTDTDAMNQSYQQVVDKIRDSTVLSALAHGQRDGYNDSFVYELIDFIANVGTHVANKGSAGIPSYNVVAFWACAVLSGSTPFPGPSNYNVQSTNRAFAGFELPLSALLWTLKEWAEKPAGAPFPLVTPTHNIGHHAEVFWDKAAEGNTIYEALAHANTSFPPMGLLNNTVGVSPMKLEGDRYTTIRYVYLTEAERTMRIQNGLSITVNWVII